MPVQRTCNHSIVLYGPSHDHNGIMEGSFGFLYELLCPASEDQGARLCLWTTSEEIKPWRRWDQMKRRLTSWLILQPSDFKQLSEKLSTYPQQFELEYSHLSKTHAIWDQIQLVIGEIKMRCFAWNLVALQDLITYKFRNPPTKVGCMSYICFQNSIYPLTYDTHQILHPFDVMRC